MYNLSQLLRLEKRIPGAALELYRLYGIVDFARYPLDLLIEQYENRENTETPYGIAIYPRSDWNGAFYAEEHMLEELSRSLRGSYQLRIVECENKRDFARRLLQLNALYGGEGEGHTISFAILNGHGSKDGISLGKGDEEHIVVDDLLGEGVKRSGSFFSEDPTFILVSCEVGESGGLAEELSKTFNATVIAPIGDTNSESIVYKKKQDAFSVRYKKAPTQVYKDGGLVGSK
jgi:hypothetical protein